MELLLSFLIGALLGVIITILRLGIKGDLVLHYVDDEDKPYMCLELNKDIDSIVKHKLVVLKIAVKDHRSTTQK